MANQDSESINARIKREMDRETKGMSPKEKEEYIRNFFAQMKTAKKTMTAAKGGMPKKKKPFVSIAEQKEFALKLKELERLGRELGISGPKPKMAGGGAVKMASKKKMRGGGMAKAAKKNMMRGGAVKKKMARGGVSAKKKMMRGGAVKKK